MNPRIVTEFDESEVPGLQHAVRRATTTKLVDVDASSAYQTMCGEMLYSYNKCITRKRGMPTCLRCVLALVEETFHPLPRSTEITLP